MADDELWCTGVLGQECTAARGGPRSLSAANLRKTNARVYVHPQKPSTRICVTCHKRLQRSQTTKKRASKRIREQVQVQPRKRQRCEESHLSRSGNEEVEVERPKQRRSIQNRYCAVCRRQKASPCFKQLSTELAAIVNQNLGQSLKREVKQGDFICTEHLESFADMVPRQPIRSRTIRLGLDGRKQDIDTKTPEGRKRVERVNKRDCARAAALREEKVQSERKKREKFITQLQVLMQKSKKAEEEARAAKRKLADMVEKAEAFDPDVVSASIKCAIHNDVLLDLAELYRQECEDEWDVELGGDGDGDDGDDECESWSAPPSKILKSWTAFRTMRRLDQYVERVRREYAQDKPRWKGLVRGLPLAHAVQGALVRLCTGLSHRRVASLFSCSEDQMRKAIEQILPHLAAVCRRNVSLPESDDVLKRHIPDLVMEALPGAVLSGDCTYIYLYEPTNFSFRKEAWCHGKHRYLSKVLILVLPDGRVAAYLRPAMGSMSDDALFEQLLEENDGELRVFLDEKGENGEARFMVYDRGLQDSTIEKHGIATPHKLKSAQHFSQKESDRNNIISSFRQVVEQVNARLRKFKLIGERFPNQELQKLPLWMDIAIGLLNEPDCFTPYYDKTDKSEPVEPPEFTSSRTEPVLPANTNFDHSTIPDRFFGSGSIVRPSLSNASEVKQLLEALSENPGRLRTDDQPHMHLEQGSQQWKNVKKRTLSSTLVAPVLHMGTYKTRIDVMRHMVGRCSCCSDSAIPGDFLQELFDRGHRLEGPAAECVKNLFADCTGVEATLSEYGCFTDSQLSREILASPDRVLHLKTRLLELDVLVECKGPLSMHTTVCYQFLFQVWEQMEATGLNHALLVMLTENPAAVRIWHVKRPPENWWKEQRCEIEQFFQQVEQCEQATSDAERDTIIGKQRKPAKRTQKNMEEWKAKIEPLVTLVHDAGANLSVTDHQMHVEAMRRAPDELWTEATPEFLQSLPDMCLADVEALTQTKSVRRRSNAPGVRRAKKFLSCGARDCSDPIEFVYNKEDDILVLRTRVSRSLKNAKKYVSFACFTGLFSPDDCGVVRPLYDGGCHCVNGYTGKCGHCCCLLLRCSMAQEHDGKFVPASGNKKGRDSLLGKTL